MFAIGNAFGIVAGYAGGWRRYDHHAVYRRSSVPVIILANTILGVTRLNFFTIIGGSGSRRLAELRARNPERYAGRATAGICARRQDSGRVRLSYHDDHDCAEHPAAGGVRGGAPRRA